MRTSRRLYSQVSTTPTGVGFSIVSGTDGFRAATCFAAMPVLREVLDHRLILHAFGVDLRPSGARVLVGRVTGGFRAATFFAMTIVSREALDHRLMAPTASGVVLCLGVSPDTERRCGHIAGSVWWPPH